MIPLESPPIRAELFLTETYDDAEYWRRYKPNGSPYQSLDCATHNHCHAGYDLQGAYHEPLLAVNDGTAHHINFGQSFGVQTLVIPTGEGYGLFYAHQAWRTISDGQRVKAGQQIGVMGTTGGVQQHLHFGASSKTSGGVPCWFNPGPQLRDLKEALMPLSSTDLAAIRDIARDEATRASRIMAQVIVQALGWGANDSSNNWLPDSPSFDANLSENNIKQVRQHQ